MRLRRRHQKITLIRVMHLGDAPRISAGANGRYGERKAIFEAEGWEGSAYQTCGNAASVASAFEMSRRRDNLSFNHDAEVAALPPAEARNLDFSASFTMVARFLPGSAAMATFPYAWGSTSHLSCSLTFWAFDGLFAFTHWAVSHWVSP